jgi:Glycosyl hydrolase catalytic core
MELNRRLATFSVALSVLALVAVALVVFGPLGSSAQTPAADPNPVVPVPTAAPPLKQPARGPALPAAGAWVGAWVKPDVPTQAGRVSAVGAFETAVGRPLDVVQVYHSTEDFPAAADLRFLQEGKTLLISWSGDDSRVITSGRDDAVIRERAEAVKALGVPILLRWRWEMNRPNLQASVWSPADYVAAWKHVRAIFTEVGATNAGWVWCPIATDFDATDAAAYYPGDDEVEWLCADVYPGPTYASFSDVSSEFMAWASKHDKPIIIAEYGAQDQGDQDQRARWLTAAGAYAQAHPQIKAMVYFESRLTQNGADRDFSIAGTAAPLAAFRAMALAPYFNQRQAP